MLRSKDGRVFYRDWACDKPKACIILVHGMGGYSGRFFEFAPYLAKNGIKPYAIELKGFGGTSTIKGHIKNFKIYTAELKQLVELVRMENPGLKVFVFGESMGGLIALDFSVHYQDRIDGIVLISPALKDKLPITLPTKISIFISALLNPMRKYGVQFDAGMFTRDPEAVKRINSDPLEVRDLTAWFFLSLLKSIIFVNMNPRKIKTPVLILVAGKDIMISAEATAAYFKKISSKDKELKWYPEMFHALYVDKDKEVVFKDIADWVAKRA